MYLEERVLPAIDRSEIASFERRLARWWQLTTRSLGPASSVRVVADVAMLPLLELLGFERPALSPSGAALVSRIPVGDCVVLVTAWTESPAAMWREAARTGLITRDLWAVASNGRSFAIFDGARSWSRASIEFEFDRLLTSPKGVAALWALARAPLLAGSQPASLRSRVAESDAHAVRVCRSLGDGVLSSLPALATSLARTPNAFAEASVRQARRRALAFDQSLTLVYRILFLLFAEARALVPVWNDLYRDAYTIGALAERSKGLWQAFQAISRLAHAGCRAGDLDVTAFNGRLFSPRHAPLVERRQVSDAVMRKVLRALATAETPQGRRRISYHDLGVEQLGSVYERVLEHEPAAAGGAIILSRTSRQRKTTGSFYTPQALTEFVVRRTLAPLVDSRSADEILQLRVVDPSMGSGAFLVAACVYLADCCEQALIRDGALSPADITAADRASLRRQVAERCLYGVDLNPTAVQLARLSLWLTTLAARKPLTFLDHHLAAGNSLIGTRLSDLSRPPLRTGRPAASLPLFDDQLAEDVSARVMPIRLRLSAASESIDIVKDKERAMTLLTAPDGPLAKWSAAADAWCAAAHWPGPPPSAGVVSEWIAAATGAPTSLPAGQLRDSLQRARDVAASHAAFHWELAFPEAFFEANGQLAANGGFDAVIGNPPWSVLQKSRGYRSHTTGHPNSYQLFLDRALQLARRGGRVGLILPSGIATDHGSTALRRQLLDRTTIDTWIGFDNKRRIFPIHRSVRFVILTTTTDGSTETLRFRCGLTGVHELHRDDRPPLSLSRSRIESWSPDHLTIPEVTNTAALGILTAVADRIPALSDPRGWNVRFGRELNATDDRARFLPLRSRSALCPIVEGKQLSPFRVDISRSTHGVAGAPSRARIAYREVASATNKLTLIAAMLPANVISTHTVFCLKADLDDESQWCLLGLINSLTTNYLVRLNVTSHVTAALMSRLRVPRPAKGSRDFARVATLAQRLAANGVDEDVDAYAELNAIAARLYGVTHEQYALMLDSFPLIERSVRDRCRSAYSTNNSHRITESWKRSVP